jgi:hypothetical protein
MLIPLVCSLPGEERIENMEEEKNSMPYNTVKKLCSRIRRLVTVSILSASFLLFLEIAAVSSMGFAVNTFSSEIIVSKNVTIELDFSKMSTCSYETQSSSSAWQLKETGRAEESFDEPKASVHIGWTILKLNDVIPTKDWYRIDFTFQQKIKEYKETGSRCGYYTHRRGLKVDVARYDDTFHDLEIYEYGPTTSQGTSTTGYTIGGGLSGYTPGFDASYSHSWSSSDVNIIDETDMVDDIAKWKETFRGPDYTWYPWYDGPCQAAKSAYLSEPSVIIELQIPFTGIKVYVECYWKIRNDEIDNYIFWIEITRTTYTITGKGNLYCDYK